ncbi:FAD binding-containing protein [Venustampulla echinocandica]|uniref:FAD binding-containing protein n=1 Tax=Venustampulla echinocandica TaxID=2656787 RepID=A0A370TGY3_9HELO|nr:FAD binding-containing protein [Venustampulla echinocandica]RDL34461.1 FAD binding-containing protein [Venustampulla echinocandica]
MKFLYVINILLRCLVSVHCVNFPWESVHLTDNEVQGHPEIAFGNRPTPLMIFSNGTNTTTCKTYPGDINWPSLSIWNEFNKTLGGALIKSISPVSVCYRGVDYNAAKCAYVRENYANSTFETDDPAAPVAPWVEGNTCPLPPASGNASYTNSSCTSAGYPAYVVNATTVKHIQLAVNFARNTDIRLIIKNTGHDFLGKSVGAGSLSIWSHNLKGFKYLPSFSIGDYQGRAARVGSGMQSYEIQRSLIGLDATIVVPGGTTVGAIGGFFQGGGHSTLTSLYGLGSDQVLAINVVTADGRFITVDPDNNDDLLYAMRGGGPGTWGVVTSVIYKAHELTPISTSPIRFAGAAPGKNNTAFPLEAFWAGIRAYFKFSPQICDRGGIGYNFIKHEGTNNDTLTFTADLRMPFMSVKEVRAFAAPLIKELNKVGLNITNPVPTHDTGIAFTLGSIGDKVGNSRFATRLFPRKNFEDEDKLDSTTRAIHSFVDGGYNFHGINYCPTEEVAGYPDNAVNPAFRKTAMHAEAFDTSPAIGPAAEQIARYQRFRKYFQGFIDVSPGAGCYLNEADVAEPNWQQAFYGDNYKRLLRIKKDRDPWGLFWMPTGVGSEDWEVKAPGGLPTQNGRLCKIFG